MRARLLPFLLLFPALIPAQEKNPTINYKTIAVPLSVAVQDIARIAEKKLRVQPPLDSQPVIVNLTNVPYETALEWIANVMDGVWEVQGQYRSLKRTAAINMRVQNEAFRDRNTRLLDMTQKRLVGHQRSRLNEETASRTILALQDPSSPDYGQARVNSAQIRLVDRVLLAIPRPEVASAPNLNHIVFSDKPKILQNGLRMSPDELTGICKEQNVWTIALRKLAKTHPELKPQVALREVIDPSTARLVVILSRPIRHIPSHIEVRIVDEDGRTLVDAEDTLEQPQPPSIDWKSRAFGGVTLSPLAAELSSAMNQDQPNISQELRDALLDPDRRDPLSYAASEGLLGIVEPKRWNLVACLTDDVALPPQVATYVSNGVVDGANLMGAIARTGRVQESPALILIKPDHPFISERSRMNRKALVPYAGSVNRTGTSSLYPQADFLAGTGPGTDLRLAKAWLTLLKPTSLPLLGSSPDALCFLGMLGPDQRKRLINGDALTYADLSVEQRRQLSRLNFSPAGELHLFQDPPRTNRTLDYEITERFQTTALNTQRVEMRKGSEKFVRILATDGNGKPVEWFGPVTGAAKVLRSNGWTSPTFSAGPAILHKLVVTVTDRMEIIHLMREFPNGLSPFGPIESLPAEYRAALQTAK